MAFIKLFEACDQFNKIAQQKTKERRVILDPKKKNADFWGNFLFHAIQSYARKFTSPKTAKIVFDNIANYNQSLAYGADKDAKDVDSISTALQEAAAKLTAAGLNPIQILKKKGMTNVNPNILNVLISNLTVMKEARDFSKYQHYYLQSAGEPKDIIELDDLDQNVKADPGY